MKRCPECRRDYYDDRLLYCLDDGSALLDGPASDEPVTAIFGDTGPKAESAATAKGKEPGGRRSEKLLLVPVLFAALAAGVYLGYRYLYPGEIAEIDTIAVLPFVNESGDAEIEYLSDGLTEAVIVSVSRLPGISVKARSSVFRYKGRDISTTEVGRELSVQAVLMGRVRPRGDQLDLSLELVRLPGDTVVWSERYSRPQAELMSLQSSVAKDISAALRGRFTGADVHQLERQATANSKAYQHYLRGRFEWNKRQKENLLQAVEHFKQAIALDPDFALAYTGLADCYIVFNSYEVAAPSEAYPLARAAVQKALEIDPDLAEAYAALAAINEDFDWDWAAAELNYRRSIELAPNNPGAHQWFGEFVRILGRFDEAVSEGRRSMELDPVSLPANNTLGITFFYAGKYDDAIEQQRKTIQLDPNYPWSYARMADCFVAKKMYAEAWPLYRKAIEMSNSGTGASWVLAHYGYALAVAGDIAAARKIEQQLRERRKTVYIEGDILAILYYGLGDIDTAFAELERGYKERSPGVRYIKVDSRYGPDLKKDKRYEALIRKIGLS
jgi:TolB-like protein/Tfp pilus assembly protein PilF